MDDTLKDMLIDILAEAFDSKLVIETQGNLTVQNMFNETIRARVARTAQGVTLTVETDSPFMAMTFVGVGHVEQQTLAEAIRNLFN